MDEKDNQEEDVIELLTPQDKFYIMAEKNSNLEKLLTEFNLQLL